MLDKELAKDKLRELVEQFSQASKNKDFIHEKNEEWAKHNYIEPLLYDVLGWKREDIEKEARVLKGRADYILKIGNEELTVIEAKKVGVSLSEDEGRQAVSYAYHRKIKFAILTNFKEIKVYHALSNIKAINNNLLKFESGGYFKLSFEQFLDNFDKLLLLSKESFEKEEINKLLSKKDEKLNKPIDVHILNDLLKIREWLSKELKSKKNRLDEEIDEIVQVLIDRLIFIRSVEDRGLEPINYLKSLEADVRQQHVKLQLFPYLLEKFKEFNAKYDSRLFEPGILEREGAFSDEVLRKVILTLYFGVEGNQERYLFDQIPVDLFGSIYEQYLGTILQGTEKRVKLEKESGKRKKMGIYYTPSYIVDYIVKNTVGEYIKDKTVDEILDFNIVDPACGSGSFLIRAFHEVCDVVEKKLKAGDSSKRYRAFEDIKEKLSFVQKVTILKNCIYGVDLDEKAVELAHLNLILAVLDGETSSLANRKLPEMSSNLKNGNSLIDDPKIAGDKAFKWEAQFPDVFRQGGFDVVIGNPPYIGFHGFKTEKEYYSTKYKSALGKYDLYVLFIEKSLELIKKGGLISYICPTGFMKRNHGENIRKVLLEDSCIKNIIDFEHKKIFGDALNYTGIFTYSKPHKRDNFISYKTDLQEEVINYNQDELGLGLWVFRNSDYNPLIDKIKQDKGIFLLSDFVDKISEGIVTGLNELYLLDKKDIEENKIELIFFKLCARGRNIRRYYLEPLTDYVFYPYNSDGSLIKENELKEKSPNYYNFLKKNISKIKARDYFTKSSKKWYELWNQRNQSNFNNLKIIVPELASQNRFMIDNKNLYYGDTVCGFYLKDNQKIDIRCLLGILNSPFLEWYYKKTTVPKANEFFIYKTMFLKQIPIKLPSPQQEKQIVLLVDQMLVLQKKLHEEKPTGNEKERLEQQIKNVDYEIDEEVYKLYELTPEEIKIVEESLK